MSEVVITGLGACTHIDGNAEALWRRVKAGQPAPRRTASSTHNQLTAALDYAGQAVAEAMESAGISEVDPDRSAITLSGSKPLFQYDEVVAPDVIADHLARRWKIRGEVRNVVAACATGAYSVALAASWIEAGLCDIAIAGSVEPPAHPLIEAGFRRMGVVSLEDTMRPFDRRRSGFVLADGAGAVILESRRHAQARRARIFANLSGWGWGCDTHSAVAFNSGGERIADVIRQGLRRARLEPDQISHVNAHGTATRSNDWIENQALLKAFGSHAGRLMISATKSSTGHLLGAAGSVELVLTLMALRDQFVPPTAHLEEPDTDLDCTPLTGHSARIEHALSLSFGFGGPIGALIVGAA